ncbi:M20 family metallopeptidase [uncultured Victivallis sp.]|uniref:M20 metallopeptidase family protein n=1 Tax=uncultured Victivallis sp. TaxID=354118 RepID=UPI0025D60793|nr:M20 family metallopeptidase [uncultured Victivallis sp.]
MMRTLAEILPGIIEFRHALHRIPEMAGAEFETARAIRERLAGLDLEVLPPFLGTDVVAILHGRGPGRNVTLRADIDALRVHEETGAAYASRHDGRMHACGHDGHAAMVMGAAELLASRRDSFDGSVRFVWQPGEENRAMGRDLIEAGALENPRADLVTALHGMPGLPVGVLALRNGAMMASCAHFKVTIRGRGGHSSRPHQAIDPVVAAAAIVVELQSVVSRRIDPQQAAVLSVCRIAGGELANVIPDEVVLEGTARALDMKVAAALETGLREVVEAVSRAHRTRCEIDYRLAYPVTLNAPEPTALARRVIRETVGDERFVELAASSMEAEDFAYYLQRYPGVYVKLGTGENCPALHNSKFDFPDAALAAGIEYLVNFTSAGLMTE